MTSTPTPRLDNAPGAERRPAAARGAAQAQARSATAGGTLADLRRAAVAQRALAATANQGPGMGGRRHLAEAVRLSPRMLAQGARGQARAGPTLQAHAGVPVNDDAGLEAEADAMGRRALARAAAAPGAAPRQAPIQAFMTVQRAPVALAHFVTGAARYTGYLSWFDSWGKLENAIGQYAALSEDNHEGRAALLASMTALSMTWTEGYTHRRNTGKAEAGDAVRKALVDRLDVLLTQEEGELNASAGALRTGPLPVSPEPRLSKEKQADANDKSAPGGGMFRVDTAIHDQDLKVVGTGHQGRVCRILHGWQAAVANVALAASKSGYYKVEAEEEELAGKNFEAIHTGFVVKADLIEVNRLRAAPGLKYQHRHSALAHPLFPHPPVIGDIVQVGLGDCYLLAAMISVVHADPAHFVNHMRDNKDGTVSVKLYGDGGQPVLVRVHKSVVVHDRKAEKDQTDAFASGAMWVKIYEKAYVAAGFHGGRPETLPSAEQSYGMTEGGHGHIAQAHITGAAAADHRIQTGREQIPGELNKHLKLPELTARLQIADHPQWLEDMTQFGYLNQIPGKLEDLLQKTFVTTADVRAMLSKEGVKAAYVDTIIAAVQEEKLLTGPLGAGQYSKGELDLFESVKGLLDAGKKMTIGTRKDIFDSPEEVTGKGGSAGESMVKGLVGPHAYAILDYAPKGHVAGQALSLKLRNPWSSYGRKYKHAHAAGPVRNDLGTTFEGAERIEDKGASGAESWFDLADIGAYFTSYSSM